MEKLNETRVKPLSIRLPVGIDSEKIGADHLIPFYKFEPHHYCMYFSGKATLTPETVEVVEGNEIEAEIKLEGSTAFMAAPAAGLNYFHWVVDMIGRMGILSNPESIQNVVLNSARVDYQKRSLEYLGFKSNIIEVDYGQSVSSNEMYVPSLRRTGNHAPSKWMVEFIRKALLPDITIHRNSPSKIYVSRRGAKVRKIINEDEVEGILVKYGFKVIKMEDYSFDEQVSLSAQADVILGPHGAGLTNSVFCKSNATLVELFAPQYIGGLFYYLSSHAGAKYLYLVGRRRDEITAHNCNSCDIYVDPQELKTLLEWL